MKIIFMGTPSYAEKILQRLLAEKNMTVVAVYTQPDKEVGRKKTVTPPVVKTLALENSIPVYQPKRLRDSEVVQELLKIECDFIIVAAYGQILPLEILQHATCINLHASILPKYRGASPIQQALLNGDVRTGITAMLMDIGLDTGDIIKIDEIEINQTELSESLFDRLADAASDLTVDVLNNFESYTSVKQDNSISSICSKIEKKDAIVEFDNAVVLYNKYRAFSVWPSVNLSSGLKLIKIELIEDSSKNESGKILKIEKDFIIVGCSIGTLKIIEVQPESKNRMSVISYINGKRLSLADTLS
ncbi:methionyl-tRNA formyltransferase [Sulfurimonas sp.]|uniref:methionyl-tRNA formyltransferase n=1 Tax=Sulfurimonas sp. TaxID=2022749 RepID=UPI0025F883C3|nr:methionyl-tRNA formyltransferase [Sulfurimonas sp.]MDD5156525.1 methionyl-tRNA formyltransferase [Sulfurimonas sp.]